MTISAFKHLFFSSLEDWYPRGEILSFWDLIIARFLARDRLYCALHPEEDLKACHEKEMRLALDKLLVFCPIQYITGKAFWRGDHFKVTPNTLIPRPETEELVDWILSDYGAMNPKILDIGTGSGCIAISLAKCMNEASVWAVDKSLKALEVAAWNAIAHQVDVQLMERDVFEFKSLETTFDVMVSNPPYVCLSEQKKMTSNVLAYEPHSALFVPDDDPLCFYECIATHALSMLSEKGALYFEINEVFGKEVQGLLKKKGFHKVQLRKDLFGKDRMVKAQLLE